MNAISTLLADARAGDRDALPKIFAALYPELRRVAHGRLSRNVRDGTLDTTALVHECFLKFSVVEQLLPEDRNTFLQHAATVMRSIIVDHVRARLAQRRGGGAAHIALDAQSGVDHLGAAAEDEILHVHEILQEVATLEPRLVNIVEMRYFAGMTEPEIAAALGISERTVRREWEKARMLLAAAMDG